MNRHDEIWIVSGENNTNVPVFVMCGEKLCSSGTVFVHRKRVNDRFDDLIRRDPVQLHLALRMPAQQKHRGT